MDIDEQLNRALALYIDGMERRALSLFMSVSTNPNATDLQRRIALGRIRMISQPARWDEAAFRRRMAAHRLHAEGLSKREICAILGVTANTLDKLLR